MDHPNYKHMKTLRMILNKDVVQKNGYDRVLLETNFKLKKRLHLAKGHQFPNVDEGMMIGTKWLGRIKPKKMED